MSVERRAFEIFGHVTLPLHFLLHRAAQRIGRGGFPVGDERLLGWPGKITEPIKCFRIVGVGGKITVTDDRMTRFWLSLDQGVRFVIHCIEQMEGGEVFVPKIPSTKVVDLARAIAPNAEINIIGPRWLFSAIDSSTLLTNFATVHIALHCSSVSRCSARWRW